jgi:hypothetical protein
MSPGPYLSEGIFEGPVSDIHSVQKHELGILRFDAGRILKYVKFGAAVTPYSWAQLDNTQFTEANQVITLAASVTQIAVGVIEYGGSSGSFGWMTIHGPATAKTATTAYAGAPLRASGTAGTAGPLFGSAPTQLPTFGVAVATGVAAGSLVLVQCL